MMRLSILTIPSRPTFLRTIIVRNDGNRYGRRNITLLDGGQKKKPSKIEGEKKPLHHEGVYVDWVLRSGLPASVGFLTVSPNWVIFESCFIPHITMLS